MTDNPNIVEKPWDECWPAACCCNLADITSVADMARRRNRAVLSPRHRDCPIHGEGAAE